MTPVNTAPIFLGFAGGKARPQWTQLLSGYLHLQYPLLSSVVIRVWLHGAASWKICVTHSNVCAHNQSQKPCFMMFYSGLPVYSCLCWVELSACFCFLFCFYCGISATQKTHFHLMDLLWMIKFFCFLYCIKNRLSLSGHRLLTRMHKEWPALQVTLLERKKIIFFKNHLLLSKSR